MKIQSKILTASLLLVALSACKDQKSTTEDNVTIAVNKENFLSGGLAEPITIESRTLSDGTTADCYKIA